MKAHGTEMAEKCGDIIHIQVHQNMAAAAAASELPSALHMPQSFIY
jgi:hypothetical protein